jgi:2-polyprenyl-3-methyl-5-hydroxy-6-metoxy-1,4-benzoquinol methylase
MPDQVTYYNQFGEQFEQSILDCPEPELWTTDYEEKRRIYHEMKERANQQEKLFNEFLNPAHPVLDIGCGFGRQAFLLAKKGFTVTGTDTSNAFIEIAKKLFEKHNYKGIFLCLDIVTEKLNQQFNQLILLDVLEHIKPNQRNIFFNRLVEIMSNRGGGY